MALFRDIQCSSDIGRMAELGKFDKEFRVYGCAYQENNTSLYHIFEDLDSCSKFVDAIQFNGVYPSSIESHSQIAGVPSGLEDEIWMEEKFALGKQLMDMYPDDFLSLINEMGNMPSSNTSLPVLNRWAEQLDGRFDKDRLKVFDGFLSDCYLYKKLDKNNYYSLKKWSDHIWEQMEDDYIPYGDFERLLHGYVYKKGEQTGIKIDAQYHTVSAHRKQLLMKGYTVSPIFSETIWLTSFSLFPGEKKKFVNKARFLLTEKFADYHEVFNMTASLDRTTFLSMVSNKSYVKSNSRLNETIYYYGKLWHCI